MGEGRYWLQTLGCPKNQVDSDKLAGRLAADGLAPARRPAEADLVVVNTCAFIEAARRESIDAVLELAGARRRGARLVVTGCLAERYGEELAAALPEVDLVAGFGVPLVAPPHPDAAPVPVRLGPRPKPPSFDLLELPRPATAAPWAYVKVAEGCDRRCGFCAIPSFRGPQRSRAAAEILGEVRTLAEADGGRPGAQEIVLVAQDLASYGRDRTPGGRAGAGQPIVGLTRAVSAWSRARGSCTSTRRASRPSWSTPSWPRESRTSISRSSTCRVRSWPGCGAGGTASGSSSASPPSVTTSRPPPSDRRSSSATPARPRRTTTRSSSSSERPSSTGRASSPSRPRRAPTPSGSATRSPRAWRSSASASAPSCRTGSPPAGATRWWGSAGGSSSTAPGWPARCMRRPRSTASSGCRRRSPPVRWSTW